MITGINITPNYRPAPKDLSFGHTLQEVLGTVTNPANRNSIHMMEVLRTDIFARQSLKGITQEGLDALANAEKSGKVVPIAKILVKKILSEIKP